MIKKLLFVGFASAVPMVAGAAGTGLHYFSDLVLNISVFLEQLIPVVIGVSLVAFLFGLLRYLLSTDEKSKAGAKNFIAFGILILFVMTTVWGLVALVGDVLGVEALQPGRAPGIPSRF